MMNSGVIYVSSLLGVAVFAVSGALAAGQKGFDWVGVVTLAVVTSLGGGTLRDVLLNRELVFWMADPNFLWVAIGSAFLTIFYCRWLKPPMKGLLIADALGLALFSILGAQVAEEVGAPLSSVVLMGIATGAAGGVLRDVLSNEIPVLCRADETIYSVAALGGILLYLLLQSMDVRKDVAAIAGATLIGALRLSAVSFNIRLPVFSSPPSD